MDAGELGAGHHATALYEVVLAEGIEPGAPIGTATVLWRSTAAGDREQRAIDVLAGPADAEASDDLALATAAADLAQLLKGAGPYAQRGVTLDDVSARVDALVDRDVAGADELAELIDLARR